ncbi:MAG: hypothetical protein ABIP35_17100 [Ginsengibacter sp.]
MPHFTTDCSSNILSDASESKILKAIPDANNATTLFVKEKIKLRVNTHKELEVRGNKTNFIHVFGYILEGRTAEQKAKLFKDIVGVLTAMFPAVEFIVPVLPE